jgi:hypothetical protein
MSAGQGANLLLRGAHFAVLGRLLGSTGYVVNFQCNGLGNLASKLRDH